MKAGAHPALAQGKVRYVGDHVAVVIADTYAQARDAAEKIDVDYGVLPAVADLDKPPSAAAAVHDAAPDNTVLQLASRRQGRDRRRLRQRRARDEARPRQQPPDPQRDGAARGGRRLRFRHRHADALHHQPEPACRAARAVGFHRPRARAQAPRHRARRRRRLRLEDLHLRRGDGLRLGGQEDRAPGQMDLRPHRSLPLRRAWPRSRHARRTGARRQRQDHRPARAHDRQLGAYLSTFASAVPTYLYAPLLSGQYNIPNIYCEVDGVYTDDRAGRRLSRRRPPGGDLPARAPRRNRGARDRSRPGRVPPPELRH